MTNTKLSHLWQEQYQSMLFFPHKDGMKDIGSFATFTMLPCYFHLHRSRFIKQRMAPSLLCSLSACLCLNRRLLRCFRGTIRRLQYSVQWSITFRFIDILLLTDFSSLSLKNKTKTRRWNSKRSNETGFYARWSEHAAV